MRKLDDEIDELLKDSPMKQFFQILTNIIRGSWAISGGGLVFGAVLNQIGRPFDFGVFCITLILGAFFALLLFAIVAAVLAYVEYRDRKKYGG